MSESEKKAESAEILNVMKRRRVEGGREAGGRKPMLQLGGVGESPSDGIAAATVNPARRTVPLTQLPLAPGWQQCLDVKTGTPYYWKPSTNETSWERPTRCAPPPSL